MPRCFCVVPVTVASSPKSPGYLCAPPPHCAPLGNSSWRPWAWAGGAAPRGPGGFAAGVSLICVSSPVSGHRQRAVTAPLGQLRPLPAALPTTPDPGGLPLWSPLGATWAWPGLRSAVEPAPPRSPSSLWGRSPRRLCGEGTWGEVLGSGGVAMTSTLQRETPTVFRDSAHAADTPGPSVQAERGMPASHRLCSCRPAGVSLTGPWPQAMKTYPHVRTQRCPGGGQTCDRPQRSSRPDQLLDLQVKREKSTRVRNPNVGGVAKGSRKWPWSQESGGVGETQPLNVLVGKASRLSC